MSKHPTCNVTPNKLLQPYYYTIMLIRSNGHCSVNLVDLVLYCNGDVLHTDMSVHADTDVGFCLVPLELQTFIEKSVIAQENRVCQ